jgi:phage protein D
MSQTHPIFRLTVGNADVTQLLKDRVLSLKVVDNAGSETDTFELRLDDSVIKPGTERIPMPEIGASVKVELGYEDEGLVYMGEFFLDEVELSADPAWDMTVRGQSANMMSPLKTLRSDAWTDMTLGKIVETIAGRNGLTPVISPELAGIYIEHVDQMNRSDFAFLTRLAVDYSAVFKVAEGQAIFALAGEDVSVTGQNITDITVRLDDEFIGVLGWRVLHQYRGRFSTVAARHYDYEASVTREVEAPSLPEDGGGSRRTLPRRTGNEVEATEAANSEARRLKTTSKKLTLNLIGEPRLSAEGKLTMEGFRDGVDGEWKIKTVTHEYSTSGLTTTVDGEVPNNAG